MDLLNALVAVFTVWLIGSNFAGLAKNIQKYTYIESNNATIYLNTQATQNEIQFWYNNISSSTYNSTYKIGEIDINSWWSLILLHLTTHLYLRKTTVIVTLHQY